MSYSDQADIPLVNLVNLDAFLEASSRHWLIQLTFMSPFEEALQTFYWLILSYLPWSRYYKYFIDCPVGPLFLLVDTVNLSPSEPGYALPLQTE